MIIAKTFGISMVHFKREKLCDQKLYCHELYNPYHQCNCKTNQNTQIYEYTMIIRNRRNFSNITYYIINNKISVIQKTHAKKKGKEKGAETCVLYGGRIYSQDATEPL